MAESPFETIRSKQATLHIFEGFRTELDDHNDRRERLIKSSRDITNLSKKLIFLLHRIMTDEDDGLVYQSTRKLSEIQRLFAAQKEDLQGDRFWHYQRCVSPGIQEYIEALSFAHYLIHDTLITWQQVQDSLSDDSGLPYFPLPVEDYLLGISDLTGELMRFAISAIPRKGGRSTAQHVCTFVRQCKTELESLTRYSRDLSKKQLVTVQSLQKIEDGLPPPLPPPLPSADPHVWTYAFGMPVTYAVAIRCFEYDIPHDMLDDIISRTLSTQAHSSYETRGRHGDDLEYGEYL